MFAILSLLFLSYGESCPDRKVIYVKSGGANVPGCGTSENGTACESLNFGFDGSGSAAEVQLVMGEGNYYETQMIEVANKLDIVGKGRQSILSKANNLTVLFSLTNASAVLTLANMQIELVGPQSFVLEDHFVKVTVAASVVFRSCRITTIDEGVLGQSIFVNSSGASLGLYGCTIYHILTLGYSMIYAENIDTLTIAGTSFVEVIEYPCFQVDEANGVVLMDSLFLEAERGGGFVTGLRSTFTASSCGFWNITFGRKDVICGALYIHTIPGFPIYTQPPAWPPIVPNSTDPVNVTITESAFVQCHSVHTGGGIDVGGSHNLEGGDTVFSLTRCSFLQCRATNGGGVFADSYSMAYITNCTFVQCKARDFGGAVYYGSLETEYFTLDLTQNEMHVVNCVFLDNDVGHVAGKGSNIAVSLYEPFPGYIPLRVTHGYSGRVTGTPEVPTQITLVNTMTVFFYENYDDIYIGSASLDDDGTEKLNCSLFTPSGGCEMPCTSNGSACVHPHKCTNGFNAINGMCTPPCLFNNEYISGCNESAEGVQACTNDYNLGCWVCILDEVGVDASCASAGPHYGDVTSNGRQCALENCKSIDHFMVDSVTNKCVMKPCSERKKNTDILNLPCGPDCYWDVGELCGANDKCIDYGTECTHTPTVNYPNKSNDTHRCIPEVIERESREFDPLWLWLIIPLSLILTAGCCGLLIFLIWKRRKQEEKENPFDDINANASAEAPQGVGEPVDGAETPHPTAKHSGRRSRSPSRSSHSHDSGASGRGSRSPSRSSHSVSDADKLDRDSRSGSRSPVRSSHGESSGRMSPRRSSHGGSSQSPHRGSSRSSHGRSSGRISPRRSSHGGSESLEGSELEESINFDEDNLADAPVVDLEERNTTDYNGESSQKDRNRSTPPATHVVTIDLDSD